MPLSGWCARRSASPPGLGGGDPGIRRALQLVDLGGPATPGHARRRPLTLVFLVARAPGLAPAGSASRCRCRSRFVLLALAYRQVVSWGGFARAGAVRARSASISGPAAEAPRRTGRHGAFDRAPAARERPGLARRFPRVRRAPGCELHPGTRSFTWNPYVRHAERAVFEEGIRSDFGSITASSTAIRRTNFPLLPSVASISRSRNVEPEEGNHAVLGMDPLSFPVAGEASNARWLPASQRQRAHAPGAGARGQHAVVLYQAVFASPLPASVRTPLGSCPAALAWTTCSQPFHARLRRRGIAR